MNDYEKIVLARERVIDAVSQNMNLYDVSDSVGRLYGLLYFQDHLMTLDEMKEELGMSKTSMSTAVRSLMDLKMVEKVWKKGVRKDLYKAQEDWYKNFFDFFNIKWRNAIVLNVKAINESLLELTMLIESDETDIELKELAKFDQDKLIHALEYYEWLSRLIDSFESREIFDFIPLKKGDRSE